ncbi:MAG: DUF2225 domain-containing protein [Candidatus Brocadiia bacterium]
MTARSLCVVSILCLLGLCIWPAYGEEPTRPKATSNPTAGAISSAAFAEMSARCPICGDFLYKHNNPEYKDFICIPPNSSKRGEPEPRLMICPVCHKVRAYSFVRFQDPSRGIDSDLCFHSGKKSSYLTNVWTCLDCGYSAYPDGFFEMPSGKSALDADVEQALDSRFQLLPSFVDWVKKELGEPLHAMLTEMVKATAGGIDKNADWHLVESQESIPVATRLELFIKCYAKREASAEFLAGLYQRAMHIYRVEFCKVAIIDELRRAFIFATPLLYEKEAFANEQAILEDLGKLSLGDVADMIGVKWAEYTPEELITKFIEVIKMLNGILDGTGKTEDIKRARSSGVTNDDIYCVKFILFLELASSSLRIGDKAATLDYLGKAGALLEGGKMFTLLPAEKQESAKRTCTGIIQQKLNQFKNHQNYMVATLSNLKESLLEDTLRAMYIPAQTYLIGDLYFRLEESSFRPAKLWLSMASRSASIFTFIGVSENVAKNFSQLVSRMQAVEEIAAAADYGEEDMPDVKYLDAVSNRIGEIEEKQTEIREKPAECRKFLVLLGETIYRYVAKIGTYPANLDDLVKYGWIKEDTADGFRCKCTGAVYGYTPPSPRHANTIYPLVFDNVVHTDNSGVLGYILTSDYRIIEILAQGVQPDIGPTPK